MSPEPNTTSESIAANTQKLATLQADLCRLVDQIDRWNGRSGAAPPPGPATAAEEELSSQIAALAGTVRQLEARLRGLEDLSLASPRKPMRMRLVELLIGREYHRSFWPRGAVPAVTAVIPAGDDDATAATVRPVLRETQAGWEVLVVGPAPGPRLQQALDAGSGRARHVLASGAAWECLDKGLADASRSGISTIIGIIHPGQTLEPTAADAVTQFFTRHPRSAVAYFERTVRRGAWRMPMPLGRRMDVYALLAEPGTGGWGHGGVFFRRQALGMVGGFKPAMRSAAEWHLYLRLTRMFGMRRAAGQVLSVPENDTTSERCGDYLEFEQARQEFRGNFGAAGRVRCQAIHLLNTLLHLADPSDPGLPFAAGANDAEPIDAVEIECPLSGAKADRLLFTAVDAAGKPAYVYQCPGGIGAIVRSSASPAGTAQPRGGYEDALVGLLAMHHPAPTDARARVLCGPGLVGGESFEKGKWQITRLPAGVPLADAALVIPEDQRFEVVWAGLALAESADPAGVLRSLVSVLAGGGIVAIAGPNFDSESRKRLGPAWGEWEFPRRPIVLGIPGVREMARLSDLNVKAIQSQGDLWLALLAAE
jgi:hypothetical protein